MENNPLAQYQNQQMKELQGRELESAVLLRSAERLTACKERCGDDDYEMRLLDALQKNQKIWAILQADIEKNVNGLEEDLRGNLLSLIRFIDRRTYELMADSRPDKLEILISINRNIAAGLAA
ncbi:MAG: flagellar biosynthesis regulator FlhF [Desulfobacterales bacterium]|nr:MAG: flagellar biosynthesis regulator FlhF [Desulfobacterales bacterium]